MLELGKIVKDKSVKEKMTENSDFGLEVSKALRYHFLGIWNQGSAGKNFDAMKNGEEVIAKFKTSMGDINITTKADRSQTVISMA